MTKLSDFKPLKRLALPELGDLRCAGLIVIVGPNSSGKTQLLRDIREKIFGEPRDLVVASDLEIDTPDQAEFLKCLQDDGYITTVYTDNDEEQYIPRTTAVGTGQATPDVGVAQLQQWYNLTQRPRRGRHKDQYLGWFSRFLITVLFLENRLTALKTVNTIDFERQAPANDLHALHLNDVARAALADETRRAFSKAVWSCAARGNQVCLRVADSGQIPSAEDRHSIHEMSKFRTIESEGDGMKSYVHTVVSLLLGRRPVMLLDEPELCLHPPQALSLGQFIGRTATSDQTATFVATHSSHVLRGVIQTAESLQIVRLTRRNGEFAARHVESEVLRDAMKKPTVRGETVLDGIFAQAVAIIEGDGDRIVYQASWEAVGASRNFDIHFATVGGTGGIADTTRLYRVLGIPVAVIADLDIVIDVPKIKQVLGALGCEKERLDALVAATRSVANGLLALPPTLSESDTSDRLKKLAARTYEWSKREDRQLHGELSALRSELNGMRHVKSGGVAALPSALGTQVAALAADLAVEGIFVVPVGELEEWLAGYGISASKRKKWAWANEAAQFIRDADPREDDVWGFIDSVGNYLTSHFTGNDSDTS